jgi:transposase InsO family protein
MEFSHYCVEHGVERHLTALYSLQQNGVVERRNQTVVAMARCLLKTKVLQGYFWGEAIAIVVHTLN